MIENSLKLYYIGAALEGVRFIARAVVLITVVAVYMSVVLLDYAAEVVWACRPVKWVRLRIKQRVHNTMEFCRLALAAHRKQHSD